MALGKGLNSLIPQKNSPVRKVIRKEISAPATASKDTIWHIPLSEIVPNTEQPRTHFDHDALESLVKSIKEHGILQPITVTEKSDGGYELIAGERRFRASHIAGLATIPALVRSATQQERLELALIENIQRQDLNPIEEGFSYQRLADEFGLKQQEIADRVGKSRSHVANTLRLLNLPDPIMKGLMDGKISAGKARALLSLKDEKEQLSMYASMIGEGITVRDVEQEVSRRPASSRKGSVRRDPNLASQEQLIEERLGTRVSITQKGEKGKITIDYNSKEEFRRIMEELI